MKYSILAEVYESLEKTSGRLDKTGIISELLKEAKPEELEILAFLVQGKLFPSWSDKEIGVARKLVVKIISVSTGFPESEVVKSFNSVGDLGLVVEKMVSKKKQQTLAQKTLTIEKVFENLRKLAEMGGSGSQDRKISLVSELISFAKPIEAKYVIKTVLDELRIGVAEGVLRDSVAKAFDVPPKDVEDAWFLLPDYSEIAKIAKEKGEVGLKKVEIKLGVPIHVPLAEKAPSLEEALQAFEDPALEFKFDGARCLIHKKDDDVWIFTRRLEDVTKAFPDIVEMVRKNVKAEKCVLDSEAVGFDPKTGKSVPFQSLSTRIKRKYDIEKAAKEIPVKVNLFDIPYMSKTLMDLPLKERYSILKKSVKETENFRLADHLETKDLKEAERFYKKALENGEEGLIVKNLDAKYQPGRRVSGGWLKVKPTMENLDLVIVAAQHGTGKRTGWFGSVVLGCLDQQTGNILECGMLGTGIKEKKEQEGDLTLDELTKMLKPLIISEKVS